MNGKRRVTGRACCGGGAAEDAAADATPAAEAAMPRIGGNSILHRTTEEPPMSRCTESATGIDCICASMAAVAARSTFTYWLPRERL